MYKNGSGLNMTNNGNLYNYGTYFIIGNHGNATFGLAVASVYSLTKEFLFTAWVNASDGFNPYTATWHQIY